MEYARGGAAAYLENLYQYHLVGIAQIDLVFRADQIRNLLDHLARLEGGVIPDVIPDGVLKRDC